MTMTTKYTAVYELGDDRWWTVRIKEISGVHSQGRSVDQARSRVREALSLFVDDADKAELVDEIKVPRDLKKVLDSTSVARRQAIRAQQRVSRLSALAAKKLIGRMSYRDAGHVLGLSHQRVQQLAGASGKRSLTPRTTSNASR